MHSNVFCLQSILWAVILLVSLLAAPDHSAVAESIIEPEPDPWFTCRFEIFPDSLPAGVEVSVSKGHANCDGFVFSNSSATPFIVA